MKVKMAMSQKWKEESCPASVETEEFEQYLTNLYGAQKYTQNDNIAYVEDDGWDNCFYKKQADQIIDKLVSLSGIEKFGELKDKFSLSASSGMTRDNLELIKSTAELLCYKLEEKKVKITPNFRNIVETSTLNVCVPGAADNMQQILAELEHSNYYDKLGFIEAMLTERFSEIFPNVKKQMEIHKNEEVKWVLHNDYKIQYNTQDLYAHFFNADPDYYTGHFLFKKELDELLESRVGVYKYVDYLTEKIIKDLPADNSFYYDQNTAKEQFLPSEEFKRIETLATELNINTSNLIEDTDENISKDCKIHYLKNYEGIIRAAIMDKLQQEGIIDFKPMTIEETIYKKKTIRYDLSNPMSIISLSKYNKNLFLNLVEQFPIRFAKTYNDHIKADEYFTEEQLSEFKNLFTPKQIAQFSAQDPTLLPKKDSMFFNMNVDIKINNQYRVIEMDDGWYLSNGLVKILDYSNEYKNLTFAGQNITDYMQGEFYNELYSMRFESVEDFSRKASDKLSAMRNMNLDQYTFLKKCILYSDQGKELLKYFEPDIILNNQKYIGRDNNLFKIAVISNQSKIIAELIKNGANIGDRGSNGDTALLWAVKNGAFDIIARLIKNGANIEDRSSNGDTALLWAVKNGKLDIVKELIRNGANIESKDKYAYTALLWAVKNSKVGIVATLIENGANMEARDKYGDTALFWAVKNGRVGIVVTLIKNGADTKAKDKYGDTALLWAVKNGKVGIVATLIKNRANKEAKDADGYTALLWAVKNGALDTAEILAIVVTLIENGADTEAKDKYGDTALFWAIRYCRLNIVAKLIENGANIEAKDKHGNTALLCAVEFSTVDIIARLIEKGADTEAKDVNGDTALLYAIKNGKLDIAKLLIENGADTEAKDKYGDTALLWAIKNGKVDIAKLLIENGANKEAKDVNGDTALLCAIKNGKLDIAKLLIENGADTEAKDKYGDTALLWVAQNGKVDIAKLLIDNGANKEAKDVNGDTALLLAIENDKKNDKLDMIRLLIENKADIKVMDEYCDTALFCTIINDKLNIERTNPTKHPIKHLNSPIKHLLKRYKEAGPVEYLKDRHKYDPVAFIKAISSLCETHPTLDRESVEEFLNNEIVLRNGIESTNFREIIKYGNREILELALLFSPNITEDDLTLIKESYQDLHVRTVSHVLGNISQPCTTKTTASIENNQSNGYSL